MLKVEKIGLLPSYKRNIKLTTEQKDLIKSLKPSFSYNELANQFNVSKRTIIFICKPEALSRNKQLRKERGGSKQYYNKEYNSQKVKESRNYKKELFKDILDK